MSLFKYRAPTGEERPWTLKEWVQGKPLGHPTHAMFVHFPVAFYIGTVALDILSKVGDFPSAPLAGTWLIIGAWIGSLFAVTTGLVDWAGMARGSTKKRVATRHMLFQLTTFAIFAVNLVVRWPDRHLPETKILPIVIGLIGVVTLSIGQFLGGKLVYQLGMRVSTVRENQP